MKKVSFRQKLKDIDKPLLIVTIILIVIGSLSIISASSSETVSRYHYSIFHFIIRHVMMLGLGGIGALIIFSLPSKAYHRFYLVVWSILVVILTYLLIYGMSKRGSVNWIEIKGIKFQPSELAKPALIMTLACLFERAEKTKMLSNNMIVGFWIIFGLLIPGIVFMQGDLGTTLILGSISLCLFLSYTGMQMKEKLKYLGIIFISGVAILGIFGMSRGYILTKEQQSRLLNFFNPCADYDNTGYQTCNAFIAFNNGGLTGLGIGKSKQKYSYIPEAHTDSIFAIIVEETGLLMGLFIIILYMIMLKRIYRIYLNASTLRGKYITFGTIVYLSLHLLLNLGGLLGILPLTGVPLPLISYGGSFTISFLATLAMVQVICVESKNQKIKISD